MSRTSTLSLVALLVLLGVVPVLFFSPDEDTYREYEPEGYVQIVGEMIDAGALSYDCESEEIDWRPRNTDDETFFANSYLRDDVESWNRGDRRAFQVRMERLRNGGCRGELVRADIGHHRHRLPTYTDRGWRGRLFMHQEAASTVLTSSERTIEVIRPPLSVLPMDAEELEDLWIRPGAPRDARSPKLALKMYEQSRPFASLETLGDLAALEVDQDRPALALNGCPVRPGTRLRLEAGDSLRLSGDVRSGRYEERFDVDTGERAGLLSFVTEVNGQPTRQTIDRSLSMADDVVQAIESAVKIVDREADFDVHLTLDAFYNDLLTRRLEEFSRKRYKTRPLRAAITLLDPARRRVLAAASYPTPTAIERLSIPPDIDEATLLQNHNFSVHAIGSATKPFLAAAALAVRPELASLELRCFPGGEAPSELLGYELGEYNLPGDCRAADPDKPFGVDFERFLQGSSNRYMLYLGLLSMADWRRGEPMPAIPREELSALDHFRLGGRVHTLRPRLPIVKAETENGTELADVAEQDLLRALRSLFGVSYDYESGLEAARLEREYWQPVLDQIPGIDKYADQLWAFHLVTPAEVNLAADLVQSFRQDLYTLLLGASNNRWSNLQLAQAMGRLLTGDGDLRAHLVERIAQPIAKDDDGEEEIEVLWDLDEELERSQGGGWPLDEQHRQLILKGMASVVEQPTGTANDLGDVLDELNDAVAGRASYRFFAKTGTPSAPRGELRDRGTIASQSARENYPGGPQYTSAVLVLGVQRSAPEGPDEHLVLTFYIEGQGGSDQAVALASEVLPSLIQGHWPQDWLAAD